MLDPADVRGRHGAVQRARRTDPRPDAGRSSAGALRSLAGGRARPARRAAALPGRAHADVADIDAREQAGERRPLDPRLHRRACVIAVVGLAGAWPFCAGGFFRGFSVSNLRGLNDLIWRASGRRNTCRSRAVSRPFSKVVARQRPAAITIYSGQKKSFRAEHTPADCWRK